MSQTQNNEKWEIVGFINCLKYYVIIEGDDKRELEKLRHWIEHHHHFKRSKANMTISAEVLKCPKIDSKRKLRRIELEDEFIPSEVKLIEKYSRHKIQDLSDSELEFWTWYLRIRAQ